MRRAAVAVLVLAVGALVPGATAKPNDQPKPPKPKLELLTETQRGALRHEAVEVRVVSRRGRRARVEAKLVVGGYPADYVLKLGSESARLRGGEAKLRFGLTRRHREVLAFGAQACEPATLRGEVRAGRRARFSEGLRRPRPC